MAARPGDKRMYDQLRQFHDVGKERRFFVGVQREGLLKELTQWLAGFKAVIDPAAASRAHAREVAPMLEIFDQSHRLVLAFTLIAQGWAGALGQETELVAKTGALVVGADEEEDFVRLTTWPALLRRHFPHVTLPQPFAPAELKKQLDAHKAAHEAMPRTTAGQVLRGTFDALKKLRAEGIALFDRMHDGLDGDFGKGPGSFEKKVEYAYDRRLRGGGANRQRSQEDPPVAPKPNTTPAPGPVASGTAGPGAAKAGDAPTAGGTEPRPEPTA